MSVADELLKYKEMLDKGIISEDEFKKVKSKLLLNSQEDSPKAITNDDVLENITSNMPKKRSNKKLFIILGSLIFIIVLIFGIGKIRDFAEASRAEKAILEEVTPIMAAYGISDFKIKGSGYFFNIECEAYANLSNKDKFELLYKLDKINSVTTSKGEHIDLSSCNVYVSQSGYYYRVTTLQVTYLGNYSTAGLYYSDNYGRYCVYEIENY